MGTHATDLNRVAIVLSDALDLVGIDDPLHGKRVAFMAATIAERAGWPEDERRDLLLAALLHDCGVSSNDEHRRILDDLDWEGAQRHCAVGYHRLARFAPLRHLALPVCYHHTHWQDLDRVEPPLSERDRRVAAVIYLADRVDALLQQRAGQDVLLAGEEIRDVVRRNRGTRFDPALVDAFLDASATEAFWFSLDEGPIRSWLAQATREQRPVPLSGEQLRQLALTFAEIVDAKSPFTAEHSLGVARVARLLGEQVGLDPTRLERLEVAGLLHDLGKLRVPDEILDKPGQLDRAERATIKRHSFQTWEILHRIPGFEDIARWAAFHHEELAGSGYPFHKGRFDLDVEARIVAVSDVFQALAQDRPYRAGLAPEESLDILRRMADEEKLDPDLVALVAGDLARVQAAARGTVTEPSPPPAGPPTA